MLIKYLYQIIIFCIFILLSLAVDAQPIVLDSTFLRYDFRTSDFYLYKDSLHIRSIEALPQEGFIRPDKDIPNLGYPKETVWARFEVQNQSTDENWILHYNWTFSDTVELYVQDSTGSWSCKYRAGYLLPFSYRPLPYAGFAYPIQLKQGETLRFYLRMHSRGPFAIPLSFKRPIQLQNEQRITDILYGGYFGLLFVMLFYNFVIWLFLKDRSYLYYSFTILCTLGVFSGASGYAAQYLWGDFPVANIYFTKVFMSLIVISTAVFANEFLNTKKYAPAFKKIFRFMIVLALIGIAHTLYDMQSSLTNRIISLHTPLLLAVGIWTWYKGNKAARFFVLAWSFYIVGGLVVTLANSGVLPTAGIYWHLAEIGSAIEVVLLSLALSDRYRMYRKEKEEAQQRALDIAEKAKNELEQKVKARTREISEKNEDLVASEEEIRQQAEELQTINDNLLDTQTELRKLSLVAEKATNAITITDANGNIVWANPSHERITGYTTRSLIGKSLIELLTEQEADSEIIKNLQKELRHHDTISHNLQLYNKEKQIYWVNLIVSAVRDNTAEQKISNYISIATDISEVQKQKELISHKHGQFMNNLNYASRIQQSLLPDIGAFAQNAFVLNLPRDIVSGDFYWAKQVKNQTLIAVADCTGHGTSAAFVTILGISLLNEIAQEYDGEDISYILRKLDERLSVLLKANEINGLADGMDIGLIRLDRDNERLDFVGANQNLFVANKNALEEYKGDRVPIGFSRMYKNKTFTQQQIPYPEVGTMLYLSSDGYPDQFGGGEDRKFMKKRFKKLLIKLHQQELEAQRAELLQIFEEWKGNQSQTDDVVVMGIRL
ncbi:MAG: PAS domain S-box protein [Bernardetiaceae bacterium]|nr:PAS domain S-box protein [Bernardetiaceae bacterium]